LEIKQEGRGGEIYASFFIISKGVLTVPVLGTEVGLGEGLR
jgi:hypothetical protein